MRTIKSFSLSPPLPSPAFCQFPGQPLFSHYSPHNSLSTCADALYSKANGAESQAGTEFHQSSVYLPDMRLTLQSLTYQSYQLIRGQGLVISHVVDTTPHLLFKQSFHHVAKIVYRSKRPPVLKSPQRPGNAFPHHIIKQIQIAFIAGTMNHAGTQDINLLVIIRISFQFPILNLQLVKDVILGSYLTFPIRPYRRGTTSSVSISPTTLSAAAFTELKNTNFFAYRFRKKSNIF